MLRRVSYINRASIITARFRSSGIINNGLSISEIYQQIRLYSNNEKPDHQSNTHIPIGIDSLIADLPDFDQDKTINNLENQNELRNKTTTISKHENNDNDNMNYRSSDPFPSKDGININDSNATDDFDTLLESLSLDIEIPKKKESTTDLTELVNSHLEVSSKDKELDKDYKPVDIDKSDENVFGFDFLDLPNVNNDKSVIDEERQLFQNIFNSYLKPAKEKSKYDRDIMKNLRESVILSQTKIDNLIEQNSDKYKLRTVSPSLKVDIFKKTQEALSSSIVYINTIESSQGLLEYVDKILIKWIELVEASRNDTSMFEEIYMNKLLRAKTKFGKKHSDFITKIENASKENPQEPILNVFTLPIIFNSVLNLLAFKFKNGQLVMSLFNILKKDINLYTVVCNQQTYNEILRAHWIFNGKSNLYGVEMIYLEMMNNGFNGDIITFNILKQIIIDYYNLKMGKSHLNEETGMSIWTKEDDRRIEFLEKRLSRLANILSGRYI